jgi:hypothetical protein
MRAIFFIRILNDFDHALPIIDYLVRKKKVNVEVYAFGCGYIECSEHLLYLRNNLDIEVQSFEACFYDDIDILIEKLKKNIGNLKKFRPLNKLLRLVFDILFFNILRFVGIFMYRPIAKFMKNIDQRTTVLADFGTENTYPYKNIINSCRRRKVPIMAYLHGSSIYINKNVIVGKDTILPEKLNLLLQRVLFGKECNVFYDKYLVSINQKETYFKSSSWRWFDNHSRVKEIGIPRYTKEWVNRFTLSNGKLEANNKSKNKKLKVVLFLSGNIHNTAAYQEKLSELIKSLSKMNGINFKIKQHPRAEVLQLIGINSVKTCISNFSSSELIEWADIGVLYSSTVAYEMLIRGTCIVVPKYIDHNTTVFEKNKVCVEIDSLPSLVNFIENYSNNSILPYEKNIEKFIHEYIYGKKEYSEMMDEFYKSIFYNY